MDSGMMEEFRNPGSIYRGAPFWAWNNRLDADQLCRQIDCFKEMGLGGFHMHPRTGMDTVYLGDEFFAMIRACRDHAEKRGMLAWLYDEDRWPSGAAGGIVTRDKRFRAGHLLFTPFPYSEGRGPEAAHGNSSSAGKGYGNGEWLAAYEIELENGYLSGYRRLVEGETAEDGKTAWYAYLETAIPAAWYNNQTYVDTLNPQAIERFIEVTHERYYQEIGESFGTTVPAIFTDEPQFVHKQSLVRAEMKQDVVIPWTTDLASTFLDEYGGDILDHLPEVFWELREHAASVWRYRYHDHVCERFTRAFSDTIGNWCEAHNIALTGHMMAEATLGSQTAALGESMRGYRSFQIPGIDVLCDAMEGEYATAKQAQSAAHQYGRTGILSELYGVTNWDFDFAGHKRQGDWQAALGITYRVHHLAMVSMAGEAKRDYPASISYQSPWYREYPAVEDHFARVNAVLTRGRPEIRTGIIHPVESYWLACGPMEHTREEREEQDSSFQNLIRWLLYGLADFDFISEALLPTQESGPRGGCFAVGEMAYDVILVPGLRTIRATTLKLLEEFADAGGRVIFTGETPSLVDAESSEAPAALAARCEAIPHSRTRILSALEPVREIGLVDLQGVQVSGCLHQLRSEGGERMLFLCNTSKDRAKRSLTLRIRGEWSVSLLDTSNGDSAALGAAYLRGWTELPCDLEAHGSLLLHLSPGRQETGETVTMPAYREIARLGGPVPVDLSEPNVLLLDAAEYRIGDGEWQAKRHLLEIDPIVRAALGMPTVAGQMAQPWTDREPVEHAAFVHLRFTIDSKVALAALQLALENEAGTRILLDGHQVEKNATGCFTDESIQTVDLPGIKAGTHCIELIIDYNRKTYTEWCYLLGDFGVEVRGDHAGIVEPVRELAYGDWTVQGLPFYAGNVTYHCRRPVGGSRVFLRIPHFAGPLVKVETEGDATPLAFAPYRAEIGKGAAGDTVDITVFGNRVNAFGQVHSTIARGNFWYGPDAWRSRGDAWADEYQLRPMGILTAPVVEERR